jgi:hypothetical protein
MLRYYRLTLILMIVTASALVGIRMIGGTHASPLTEMFTTANGSLCKQPCLFGIRPNEATGKEAIALLKSHPLTRGQAVLSTNPVLVGDLQGGPLIVLHQTSDGLIDGITLSSSNLRPGKNVAMFSPVAGSILLGDMVAMFGDPDVVDTMNNGDFAIVYFNIGLTVSVAKDGQLALNNPVKTLAAFNMPACSPNALDHVSSWWVGTWVGFARDWRSYHVPSVEPSMQPSELVLGASHWFCR